MRPVRFVETLDQRSLAWTRSGATGAPSLIKAAAWLTHLEFDAESPVWSHYVTFLEKHFDYIRYDERGCGLSDRDPGRLDVDAWTDDLSRVVDAAAPSEPFVLFAMSQGTAAAVSYAVAHPDSVSHLVILGGYARGVHHRGDPRAAALYDAVTEIFRAGFDEENTAFREVLTKRFLPEGTPDKVEWFNDLCRRTTTAETGAMLLAARGRMDVSDLLSEVTVPTLVLHAEGDGVAPVGEGRFLAQRIPGAVFSVLPSKNHILQADEPAWDIACREILEFTQGSDSVVSADLTAKERDVLALICQAKANKEIARDLDMSEKTVRNHATRIFAKLGVSNRQEAILKVKGAGT